MKNRSRTTTQQAAGKSKSKEKRKGLDPCVAWSMHGTMAMNCSQITGGPGSLRKKGQKSNTNFNSHGIIRASDLCWRALSWLLTNILSTDPGASIEVRVFCLLIYNSLINSIFMFPSL
jgi:hypothetical protein